MFSAAGAARFLDEAHRARARYQNLPEAIAPRNFDDAYAAQEALCALWEPRLGPIAGRKIAVTTKVMQELMGIDHPCGGTSSPPACTRSPASIKQGRLRQRAHRMRAGRPPRPRPAEAGAALHARERRAAVGEIMAAFELIEDRHADYKSSKALSLIADNAWNGGIVIGAATAPPAGSDLNGIRGALRRNGKEERSARPMTPWARWPGSPTSPSIARPADDQAGMVVITGSLIATVDIAPGERLDFAIDGVGDESMTAA